MKWVVSGNQHDNCHWSHAFSDTWYRWPGDTDGTRPGRARWSLKKIHNRKQSPENGYGGNDNGHRQSQSGKLVCVRLFRLLQGKQDVCVDGQTGLIDTDVGRLGGAQYVYLKKIGRLDD